MTAGRPLANLSAARPQAPRAPQPIVPLTKLDNSRPELLSELMRSVREVAERAAFTLGEEVEAFESEFASFCGAAHAVAVSSGTEALGLVLRALGVGVGDEVIVPANSFIATAEAVSWPGARPRFADVDPATALMTAATIESALGPQVRAVIPVHLYGRTLELDPIVALARERGLHVIEDAAQAHGAVYRGNRVGSLADCACFSFYPSKNLGGWGDGGAVVTGDAELASRVRLLRSHGERSRYEHEVVGTTARLDGLQAAVLRVKLRQLDEDNRARRAIAHRLDAALAGTVGTPRPPEPGHDHVYHQYVVHHKLRDELREHLYIRGVATAIHYPVPIHRTAAYRNEHDARLPVTERLADTICSLPMYPDDDPARARRGGRGVHELCVREGGFDPVG